MDYYIFTWSQSLATTVIILIGFFLAVLACRYCDSYGLIPIWMFIFILTFAVCGYILFPPGSENTLRLDAERSLRNDKHEQYLIKHREAQKKQERLIRERMEKLRIKTG